MSAVSEMIPGFPLAAQNVDSATRLCTLLIAKRFQNSKGLIWGGAFEVITPPLHKKLKFSVGHSATRNKGRST